MTYRELQSELKFQRDILGRELTCKLNAAKEVLAAEYRRLNPPKKVDVAAWEGFQRRRREKKRRQFAAAAIAKFGTRRRQSRRDNIRGFGLDSGISHAVVALQAAMARTNAALAGITAISDEIHARRAA